MTPIPLCSAALKIATCSGNPVAYARYRLQQVTANTQTQFEALYASIHNDLDDLRLPFAMH